MKKLLFQRAMLIAAIPLVFVGVKAYDHHAYGPADLANGKVQYTTYCIDCHGVNGHGGPRGASLQVPADSIVEELANPLGLKQELIWSVYTGDNGQQGQMPAFRGVLSKKDINDALEYIRSVNE